MSEIRNVLMLNIKAKELRDQLFSKSLPAEMTADDVFKLEEEAYRKSVELLNQPADKTVNLVEIKDKFTDAISNITQDAVRLQTTINSLSNLDLNKFMTPAAKTVNKDGKVSVELLKEIPQGVELFLASIIDKNKVRDLTIEDIRDCGSMGDYEQVLLPFIHKVINKFKEINNI